MPGAGAQWSIGDAEADLRSDGRLEIDVEGLIVTPLGRNPLAQFKAIVSCQSVVDGAPAVVTVSTDAFDASMPAGDAQITFKTRIARQVIFNKQWYRLALELHVIDNGPGVPDSIRDRIFYPLVSGREGGSGLGLTLAQTFVQQHHGLIECDSAPGKTEFKILIPLP